MAQIAVKNKIRLGMLLADGHRKFGEVAPRRPYYEEEEEERGGGAAKLLFETHPLLADLPIGAPSDLAHLIEKNGRTVDEAEKRSDQASPQLRKALEHALRHGYRPPAVLTPYTA